VNRDDEHAHWTSGANDHSHNEDIPAEEIARWPTRAQAAKILRVSLMTIRRMQDRGELIGVRLDGEWRFDPADLDALRAASAELGAGDLLAATAGFAKQATAHAERLVTLVTEPASQLLEALTDENRSLRKRVANLEEKNAAMLEASEKALSLAHERALSQAAFDASNRRKERALDTIEAFVPHLVSGVMAKLAPGNFAAQEHALCSMLANLSDEQMAAITQSGVFAPEHASLLIEIRKALRTAAAERQASASTGGTAVPK
jgi:excisionase family DNA binding protein